MLPNRKQYILKRVSKKLETLYNAQVKTITMGYSSSGLSFYGRIIINKIERSYNAFIPSIIINEYLDDKYLCVGRSLDHEIVAQSCAHCISSLIDAHDTKITISELSENFNFKSNDNFLNIVALILKRIYKITVLDLKVHAYDDEIIFTGNCMNNLKHSKFEIKVLKRFISRTSEDVWNDTSALDRFRNFCYDDIKYHIIASNTDRNFDLSD